MRSAAALDELEIGGTGSAARIEETRTVCESALRDPVLKEAAAELRAVGIRADSSFAILSTVTEAEGGQKGVLQLRDQLERRGFREPFALERLLLVRSALQALGAIFALSVTATVKRHFLQAFTDLARPSANLLPALDAGHYPFVALSKIATLRRFPAGQFDWEVSGVPRSFFWKARTVDLPRFLACVCFDLRGLRPLFMPHFSIFRRHWLVLRQTEVNRSYYQMARALQQQPHVRGMVASSWFYSPDTYAVSPHLAWLRSEIVENDGFAATLGPAPHDGGFLQQGIRRRELFEKREFRPTDGLVIWPRAAMLRWADKHPEYNT